MQTARTGNGVSRFLLQAGKITLRRNIMAKGKKGFMVKGVSAEMKMGKSKEPKKASFKKPCKK